MTTLAILRLASMAMRAGWKSEIEKDTVLASLLRAACCDTLATEVARDLEQLCQDVKAAPVDLGVQLRDFFRRRIELLANRQADSAGVERDADSVVPVATESDVNDAEKTDPEKIPADAAEPAGE